ncbi:MAG: hypothetical protein ABI614_11985, partial [Planctomycetota bacterium]
DLLTLDRDSSFGGLHVVHKQVGIEIATTEPTVTWRIQMQTAPAGGTLKVEEMVVVLAYHWDSA